MRWWPKAWRWLGSRCGRPVWRVGSRDSPKAQILIVTGSCQRSLLGARFSLVSLQRLRLDFLQLAANPIEDRSLTGPLGSERAAGKSYEPHSQTLLRVKRTLSVRVNSSINVSLFRWSSRLGPRTPPFLLGQQVQSIKDWQRQSSRVTQVRSS